MWQHAGVARKAGSDSAETMESIVRASRAILRAEGASGLSFRRVSKEAGVSVGTIAYYFPDRSALVEACLDAHHEWIAEELERLVAMHTEGAPLAEVAAEAVRSAYRAMVADRETLRLRRIRALEEGELDAQRRVHSLGPALDAAASLWVAQGASAVDARLTCQSMIFLVTRYALLSDDEVCELTGEGDVVAARNQAEAHLLAALAGHVARLTRDD